MVESWVSECDDSHSKCRPSDLTHLPHRVLDVAGPTVRLVEPTNLSAKYTALSHCWGKEQLPIRTTRTNLQDWKVTVPWFELPRTFQDAITLTRRLGIKYLWIDSLCIIQDDEADWEVESARMAEIFENAYLTICATRSKNGNEGLFSDRHKDTKASRSSNLAGSLPVGNLDTIDGSKAPFFGRLEFQHHSRQTKSAFWVPTDKDHGTEPLLLRAWAFQERLLACRTLDFLHSEVVWECRDSQQCECMFADRQPFHTDKSAFHTALCKETEEDVGSPIDSSPATPTKRDRAAVHALNREAFNINRLRDDGPLQHSWEQIVTAYTELALTYDTDRLPALSGIAQRVARIDGSQYLAGLWANSLPKQLLWFTNSRSGSFNALEDRAGKRVTSYYRAPTWSWASVEAIVRFHQPMKHAKIMAFVKDIRYTPKGVDPFGHCAYGALTVRGPATTASLSYRNLDLWTIKGENGDAYFLPDSADIEDKDSACFVSKGSLLSCLQLLRDDSYGYGLVLRQKKCGNFERIGSIRVTKEWFSENNYMAMTIE